jgi:antagonist of KipI
MIRVVAPGLFTTVQDLGRPGYGAIGISPAGAADPIALRIGNRLVGNAPGAAALEVTLAGPALMFEDGGVVALAGAEFDASVPCWSAQKIEPGQLVRIGHARSGARCYFCVRGGIAVDPWLGSASTHVLSGLGGIQGRALKRGDVLEIGGAQVEAPRRAVRAEMLRALAPRKRLRVTWGPQSDWFSEAAKRTLFEGRYIVTEEANRMGLRLAGPELDSGAGGRMITEGVSLGAIQVPPGGHPIILFVDQQTTGGYPVIANVISADLASVGQFRPRDEITFELVSLDAARALFVDQEALLARDEDLFC